MEYHIRKLRIPLEPVESVLNYLRFARSAIGQCNHEVMILILAAKEIFLLFLCLFPLSQDIGQGFRDPYFSDAGFRLGSLEDNSRLLPL